jgi:hypothetical protein
VVFCDDAAAGLQHQTQQSTTQEALNNVEQVFGQCGAKGDSKTSNNQPNERGDQFAKFVAVLC